jgi:hypothetical protein
MVRNNEKYHVIEKKEEELKWNGYIQCWRFLETIEKHHHWKIKIK